MRNNELLEKLNECIIACNYCADACLTEDNVSKMADCIKTDRECAAICTAMVQVISSRSNNSKLMDACIDVCERCEQECRKHDHDHCQKCADACRACLEACQTEA